MRLLSDDRKRDVGKERPCKAYAFSCWDCVHCVNGATYSGADHNLTCSNLLCNLLIPISCIELQGKQRIPWIYLHTIVTSCCTNAWSVSKQAKNALVVLSGENVTKIVVMRRSAHPTHCSTSIYSSLLRHHNSLTQEIITKHSCTCIRAHECLLKVCEPCSFQLHLMPSVSCDWLLRSSESFRCILMQKITGA